MKGDFSRLTFQPANHYRNVRLQQGRVQLDADWNEQTEIQAHLARLTTLDEIGPSGAPVDNAGLSLQIGGGDVQIGAGHFYVAGILCENENVVPFTAQPDLPGVTRPTQPGVYVAYVDVWLRNLTALEEPALREVALGGPDTATRAKTIWQVKLERAGDVSANLACPSFGPSWEPSNVQSTGQLRAQPKPGDQNQGECLVPDPGGYRRLDNQLYRVEIHKSGPDGTATFLWSRDNGSIVTRLVDVTGNDLTVSDPGLDSYRSFVADQWVELSDEGRVLRGEVGILVQLDKVQGNVLTVKAWPNNLPLTLASFGTLPTVRRWDSAGEVTVTTADYLDLGNDGVQIEFAVGNYQIGDYWTIPARTQTLDQLAESNVIGGIDWPRDTTGPTFQPRQGIRHHYAALGLLSFDGTTWTVKSDCRPLFPPLTDLVTLFYVGGDGQEARPGNPLPQPLEVGVFNGSRPVAGATVQFVCPGTGKVAAAVAGLASASSALLVATDADGIASCHWQPDPTVNTQQLVATLTAAVGNPIRNPTYLHFNANLSVASEVAYNPAGCATLANAGVTNVQDAINQLCQAMGREPGILIKEVRLIQPNAVLGNDTRIAPAALGGGLRVVLDGVVDPLAIRGKPIGAITLELPFPGSPVERESWLAPGVVGFQPVILSGEFISEGAEITWTPNKLTQTWLADSLVKALVTLQQTSPILVHFTLKGNFIWAQENPSLYLDGEAYGVRGANGVTDLRFTGDGRSGGNFEMWFYLEVQTPAPAVTLQSLTLAAPIVVGGAATLGTVTLSGPAGPNGAAVALASNNPGAAAVPASITVLPNQNAASFPITVLPFIGPLTLVLPPRIVTISASFGGATQSATLTVRPTIG
ncbi:MAG TPA: DUF6519 domain-containing protein [Chloroflexota bacterium]|nr:DUF6519 domain-containing protein [Chloroflexota bacterium]